MVSRLPGLNPHTFFSGLRLEIPCLSLFQCEVTWWIYPKTILHITEQSKPPLLHHSVSVHGPRCQTHVKPEIQRSVVAWGTKANSYWPDSPCGSLGKAKASISPRCFADVAWVVVVISSCNTCWTGDRHGSYKSDRCTHPALEKILRQENEF